MMKTILSSELNKIERKIKKNSTRSPSQYPDYDAEEQVTTINECKDFVVVFDYMLKKGRKIFLPF